MELRYIELADTLKWVLTTDKNEISIIKQKLVEYVTLKSIDSKNKSSASKEMSESALLAFEFTDGFINVMPKELLRQCMNIRLQCDYYCLTKGYVVDIWGQYDVITNSDEFQDMFMNYSSSKEGVNMNIKSDGGDENEEYKGINVEKPELGVIVLELQVCVCGGVK